mgnify:CR=1 FL=1
MLREKRHEVDVYATVQYVFVFPDDHAIGARRIGVLLLAGDDHTCKSSTTSHQSEFAFVDSMIPVLNAAGIADILEFGLHKPAYRICVNTPTTHGSIGLTSGMDPALTLGCVDVTGVS